jgi:hypothetical protein
MAAAARLASPEYRFTGYGEVLARLQNHAG